MLVGAAALVGLLLPGTAEQDVGGAESSPLLEALRQIEIEHDSLCGGDGPPADVASSLESLLEELPGPAGATAGQRSLLGSLNRLVFGQLGIRGSQDLRDPCNLLLSRVLERKQGYCVGIAALYLVLAEQLNLPIFAVATPSHVFLRYDDGTTRINIETFQQGASVTDEQYIREQKIPEESIRRGIFMRNLTTEEFLAQVHNNLGVVYSERKDFEKAAREYEEALKLDPHFPAALYNWGNDLLKNGSYRRAVRLFSNSLRLYPTDVWALNNRGLANLKMGKTDKARRDFEEALKIEPAFEQARRNLAGMQSPQ